MRLQPWTETALMAREAEFEELCTKAVEATVRTLRRQLAGPLTAAVNLPGAPPETAPEVSFSSVQGAVMATWTTQVQEHLMPFLVDTFLMSAETVVDGVEAATGTAVEALTNIYAQDFLEYAQNRMVGIGEDLWVKIRSELMDGFAAGEGIKEIATRLQDVAELSLPRALTVARTEVISAANAGSYLQMIDAGFADNEVKKVWLATEDPRTRKSHRHADNQGVQLTAEFALDIYSGDVKTGQEFLEFPGDPSGTPGNIINCRCSLAFDFDEDAVLTADAFQEHEHPRDKDGKFKKKGAPDKFVPDAEDSPYTANAKAKAKSISNLINVHKSLTAAKAAEIVKNLEQKAWDVLPDEDKSKLMKKALGNKANKDATEKKLEALQAGKVPPGANASKFEKISYIVDHKLDDLSGGQKVQLLKNTDQESWDKLTQTQREKVANSIGSISHPEDKHIAQKRLDELFEGQGSPNVKQAIEKAVGEAAEAKKAAAPSARPLGGTLQKTGKKLEPGKEVFLRVQLLYQTDFENGAVMAVRKDSDERIVFQDGKILRQKKGADGKFQTTHTFTKKQAYDAWKDESGWTIPDASDTQTQAAAEEVAPSGVPEASGKGVALRVKLIYQTPFADGDVVAVNPGKGEWITWDEGKKRMVVHDSSGGSSEFTRGALYKAYKDDTGWFLPKSKKSAPAAPAKKAAPAAKAAVPKAKKAAPPVLPVPADATPEPAPVAAPASAPGAIKLDENGLPRFTGSEVNVIFADPLFNTSVPPGELLYEDANFTFHKANYADEGDLFVVNKNTGKSELIKNKDVDAGTVRSAVLTTAKPAPEPYTPPKSIGGENTEKIKKAMDDPAVLEGTVLFESTAFNTTTKIVKTDDGMAEVTHTPFTGESGKAKLSSHNMETSSITKAVVEAKQNALDNEKAKVSVTPMAILAQNSSEVQDDDVADIKDLFEGSNTQINDLLFENQEIEVEKLTDSQVMVTHKASGAFTGMDVDDLSAEKLNDFIEQYGTGPAPAAPAGGVSSMAQDAFDKWKKFQGQSVELGEDDEVQVYKAASGNVLIQSAPHLPLSTGIVSKDNITAENLDKAIKAVKDGKNFNAKDPIPDVGTPVSPVSAGAQSIFDAWDKSTPGSPADLFEDNQIEVIKTFTGNIVVYQKGTPTKGVLISEDVTPANIDKMVKAVKAGHDVPGGSPIPDVDQAGNGLSGGSQSVSAGQVASEIASGINSVTVDPSQALQLVYDKNDYQVLKASNGTVGIIKQGVTGGHASIEGFPTVTEAQIQDVIDAYEAGKIGNGKNFKITNANVVTPAPTVAPVPAPATAPKLQFPLKMTSTLLIGPQSKTYKHGQVIAENPGENERIYWNASTKKYVVQAKDENGNWSNIYSYNKQAAYKNLKGDTGWVTPSQTMIFDAGNTAGTAPTPSISGGGTVAPTITAPAPTTGTKLKFTTVELKAAADSKVSALTDPQVKKIYTDFRTKTPGNSYDVVRLTSPGEEVLEAVLRAQKKYHKDNPGSTLNMLEIIRAVDIQAAKDAGAANSNLFEKKLVDWLGTPAGKKKAPEVLHEFRLTPAEKAKLEADKKAAAQAALDAKLAAFHAVPKLKPATDSTNFPMVNTMTAASFYATQTAQNPLTSTQQSALKKYTGSYYHTINGMLRGQIPPTDQVIKDATNMQKGMRPLPQDVLVFRGINPIAALPGDISKYAALIGTEFTEPGFSSTSITHPFGGKIKLEIEAPKGTPGVYVKSFSNVPSENEILLGAGMNFKILSAKEEGGRIVVRVRVVP